MRRGLRTIVVLALVIMPVGCGGDGDDEPSAAGSGATSTVPAPAGAATATAPTTTSPAVQTESERVGACLKQEGYRLQGGAPGSTDSESPEYQIIFSGPRGGGYIGFYKNASRARRVAAQLRKNAQRTTGADVERHGAINVVWVDLPDQGARRRVRACLTV